MTTTLGPREIRVRTQDGDDRAVSISIAFEPVRDVDLGGGATIEEHVGRVLIESENFSKTMRAPGSDELQVVYHLLRLTNIYLAKLAEDAGLQFYRNVPGDIGAEGVFF